LELCFFKQSRAFPEYPWSSDIVVV